MQMQHSDQEGFVILEINEARINANNAQELKRYIEQLVSLGRRRVLVGVDKVNFVDSTGLGALVACLKLVGRDGAFVLCGATPPVMSLLKLTQMDRVLRNFATIERALESLTDRTSESKHD